MTPGSDSGTSTSSQRRVQVVLVAGGRGTRMGELSREVPKPMLPIGGRPLLARQIDLAAEARLHRVVVLTGHRAEFIERNLPALVPPEVDLTLVCEPQPAGSGGCLRFAPGSDVRRLVIFGDVLVHMDLESLLAFHDERHRSSGAVATAVVHPNDHPEDSDLVEVDGNDRIVQLHRKPHPPDLVAPNLVTAGVFVLEPEAVEALPAAEPADLVHDLLNRLIDRGDPVYAYSTPEYLKDMGTPERYARADEDFERGLVEARHRRNRRPAAFLDRDGTLNRHVGHLRHPDQLALLPGVAEAIRLLNRKNILAVVVTNQPVLARGECTERELARIHAHLEMELGRHGAYLDRIYHCPHHPDRGFDGEVRELKIDCDCRKPKTGMIEAAARELPVDLSRSALFGDSARDVEAALRAGLGPWLLDGRGTDPAGRPKNLPETVRRAPDLARAVDRWLREGNGEVTARSD